MSIRQAAAGFLKRLRFCSPTPTTATCAGTPNPLPIAGKMKISYHCGSGGYTHSWQHRSAFHWIFLSGQAAIILAMSANPVLAEDKLSSEKDTGGNLTGLRRIEDGSVISNEHTSKWRIFTDNGRDFFLQGKLEEAERFFLSALQEAKQGFGEKDPHVASACNNLAELYRVKKAFDKAEPLYLEAINILEESFGPDDVRVGAALHNLGQFYLVQRKLEEARICYERALKIKRRVLGEGHTDCADTMYHLGTVLYLQGKEKDAEAYIQDSIWILEEAGQGESIMCIKQLRYLSQIYIKSNRPAEAEKIQRKILHIMELSKGWNSLDTVIAAEGLALTLQSLGGLKEAQELLERCLDARKSLLPEDHIQVAANMLHLARVEMLKSSQLKKTKIAEAIAELDKAKDHLENSIRIAWRGLDKLIKQKGNLKSNGISIQAGKAGQAALLILLQSLNALALLGSTKLELLELREEQLPMAESENALCQCISAFKEFGTDRLLSNSTEVKAEYLSCLKHLSNLISNGTTDNMQQSGRPTLQELKEEIRRVEAELSSSRKRRN